MHRLGCLLRRLLVNITDYWTREEALEAVGLRE
jgi:hypothetical protein